MLKEPGVGAADIGPMTVRLSHRDDLAVPEDRTNNARVVEVGATLVDIVHDEDVPLVHVVSEVVQNGFRRVVQSADVGRDVSGSLHDGIAIRIAKR